MDIVIIGSGNAATVLGRKFRAAGHRILQIVSRNASEASALAYEWDTESTNYLTVINPSADLYLIAVTDTAISGLVTDLRLPGKVVVHTAASVPRDVLKNVSAHHGVFYPLQSLSSEMTDLPDIPIFIDASDDFTRRRLESLAATISKHEVAEASDEERMKLHVAAVMVNNFINHLYSLVEDFCRKEGLDFKKLIPLMEETTRRIENISPGRAQTGPAARGDQETIDKHLAILEKHPRLQKIYLDITNSIRQAD